MDLTDASAMTEASGLVDRREGTADLRYSSINPGAGSLLKLIRDFARAAPVPAVTAAFLLGWLIGRRR